MGDVVATVDDAHLVLPALEERLEGVGLYDAAIVDVEGEGEYAYLHSCWGLWFQFLHQFYHSLREDEAKDVLHFAYYSSMQRGVQNRANHPFYCSISFLILTKEKHALRVRAQLVVETIVMLFRNA